MKREHVESSNIESVGYDSENKLLEIEFNHGGIYQYFDVPQSVFSNLMNASSHGQYFDRVIKKGGFTYKKLR